MLARLISKVFAFAVFFLCLEVRGVVTLLRNFISEFELSNRTRVRDQNSRFVIFSTGFLGSCRIYWQQARRVSSGDGHIC